jgi:hypothetical protein
LNGTIEESADELHQEVWDLLKKMGIEDPQKFCAQSKTIEELRLKTNEVISNQDEFRIGTQAFSESLQRIFDLFESLETKVEDNRKIFLKEKDREQEQVQHFESFMQEKVLQNGFREELMKDVKEQIKTKADKELVETQIGNIETSVNKIETDISEIKTALDDTKESKWELIVRIMGYIVIASLSIVGSVFLLFFTHVIK